MRDDQLGAAFLGEIARGKCNVLVTARGEMRLRGDAGVLMFQVGD